MSNYGFQHGYQPGALEGGQPPPYSGPPPPYQQGAPLQPGAPPFQPGAPPYQPNAPPFQPGAPPFQPGAPPYQPGAPQPGFQQGFPPPYSQSNARSAVIRHSGTGLCLDGSEYEVKLQNYNGSPSQIWFLEPGPGGSFIIKNKGNGAVIDIEGGPDCGANLVTYEKHGGDNQQWFINNPDNTIVSAAGQNLAIDVYEGNCYPGNFLIAYDRHGGPNQQFRIEYQS